MFLKNVFYAKNLLAAAITYYAQSTKALLQLVQPLATMQLAYL